MPSTRTLDTTANATTRTVLVTTFDGAVVLATADCSTLVAYDELGPLISDLIRVRDQLTDAS